MSNRSGIARLSASKTSTIVPLKTKDFLSVLDLEPAELDRVLELAAHLKRDRATGHTGSGPLAGQHVALLFDKPSLRTRATFVIAIHELGGQIIEPLADAAFGRREALGDVAKSLERWVTTAVVRTLGTGAAAAVCSGGCAGPARHQRPHQRRASVPGAGGFPDRSRNTSAR